MAEETPLFAQYRGIKAQHPGEVLFFRLGDFYEMFDDDAQEVSRLLNLTLTHRGDEAMCGVPYHAAKIYIARLLRLGKKIAIAEQVGEIAHGKGLTERKVVEIITPGTAVESEYLEGGINNFLASFFVKDGQCGFAFIDVTTGEFKATSFSYETLAQNFPKELGRVNPKELILCDSLKDNAVINQTKEMFPSMSVSYYPDWNFNAELSYSRLLKQFGTVNLRSFSLNENSLEVPPAGFLLDYIQKTTNSPSPHVKTILVYRDTDFVIMDDSSRRNLEIITNLRDQSRQFTLLECVDSSCTAMGSRMIRSWLTFPLTDRAAIESRLDRVESFFTDRTLFFKVREALNGILDVERLASRIAMDKAHAKDLLALKSSLLLWKKAASLIKGFSFSSEDEESCLFVTNLIQNAILENPSTSLTEGGIIKSGWSAELDKWRSLHDNFNQILEEYAEDERRSTGIQNLRIKKSGNMGYFIEVTKGKLDMVPSHFIMRRALVNADRYTTQKLQELEQSLNESDTRILELERDLFLEVRSQLKKYVPFLQSVSEKIAYADVTSTFADAAIKFGWVRPHFSDKKIFCVKNGRHPVVERHLNAGEFVPNDLELCSGDEKSFALITGPNMAGKSTFLRQNALITLLAQTGSFVPAESALLSIVDRIFCRVGASDNLARGESTFLVEMTETAHILRSATEASLVIMDEVGRGTSTEDGLSIARAVSEFLINRIKCKTLFATHYHELTRMESPYIKKLCMAVDDSGECGRSVVFLRKVINGSSQNSFGLHVARLAGLPQPVIDRANVILESLQKEKSSVTLEKETEDFSSVTDESLKEVPPKDSSAKGLTGALFSDEELILDEILSCDFNNITPVEALQMIMRWKKTLNG